MIKKIDHIAIAVKNLAEEITRYRDVLGLEYLGSGSGRRAEGDRGLFQDQRCLHRTARTR